MRFVGYGRHSTDKQNHSRAKIKFMMFGAPVRRKAGRSSVGTSILQCQDSARLDAASSLRCRKTLKTASSTAL